MMNIANEKVFVGGSQSLRCLPEKAKSFLDGLMQRQCEILIGDCFGADAAVQAHLKASGYQKVVIYYTGDAPRHNLGGWKSVCIPSTHAAGTYERHHDKDIAMQKLCDSAFMIWDGKSRGTKANIDEISCDKLYIWQNLDGEEIIAHRIL